MHLVYTLIAGGLLVLSEVPTEQPPPIPHHTVAHAEGRQASRYRLEDSYFAKDFHSQYSVDPVGELYLLSSPDLYLGNSDYLFPIEFKQDSLEVRQPPQANDKRLQDSPESTPSQVKTTATPLSTLLITPVPTSVTALSTQVAQYDRWQATYSQRSVLPITGLAMFYNPNVMQEVVNNRLAMGQLSTCAECIGNVALLRAGDLNRRVWVQWADGTIEGPFLVADVAAIHHIPQLVARNWAIDVDHQTALRHKMNGPVMVTVWDTPPTQNQATIAPFSPLYPTVSVPIVSTLDTSRVYTNSVPNPTIPLPTDIPLPTQSVATSAPISAQNLKAVATSIVTLGGFPPDTPIPTITPLPALNATPTVIIAATQGILPPNTPMPTATSTIAVMATNTVTALPVPTHGFPPDTPIPTITPLPAIGTLPSPTLTVGAN